MAILAKRANAFGQTKPRGRTNLRLWETITGSVPLFPDCYLQWMAQLQRVEATQPGPPELRPPLLLSCRFTHADLAHAGLNLLRLLLIYVCTAVFQPKKRADKITLA
jgi:hypothetical protein